jgi:hypothetical protein
MWGWLVERVICKAVAKWLASTVEMRNVPLLIRTVKLLECLARLPAVGTGYGNPMRTQVVNLLSFKQSALAHPAFIMTTGRAAIGSAARRRLDWGEVA